MQDDIMKHYPEKIEHYKHIITGLETDKQTVESRPHPADGFAGMDVKGDFLTDKDNRQEVETLTPFVLKESGEIKFRQHFELLYPLFLPRLREKVPSVTRREELLSMLMALKQDNKKIAELLAIEPRSVLMLRHRLRQKIGMGTEFSLENFIEDLLD